VHQKPRGHVTESMRVVFVCRAAVDVTVTFALSAVASEAPSASSLMDLTVCSSWSIEGATTSEPSAPVAEATIVIVSERPLLCCVLPAHASPTRAAALSHHVSK